MTTNVGTLDRLVRAILGLVLLYLAFASALPLFEQPLFKWGGALVGLILLGTALFRLCPLYSMLGLKTCRDC